MATRVDKIKKFLGVVRNADLQDIPFGSLYEMKNFKSERGKLIKTFGMGPITGMAALSYGSAPNSVTFYADRDEVNDYDYFIFYTFVDPTDNTVEYFYSRDGSSRVAISVLCENLATTFDVQGLYKNADALNPILADADTVRFLSGHDETTYPPYDDFWLGRFKRNMYGNAVILDYGWYGFPNRITAPNEDNIDVTFAEQSSGTSTIGQVLYYKFSFIYDELQESLLSGTYSHTFVAASKYLSVAVELLEHDEYRRTGLKIYRSSTADGDFELVDTISFTSPFGSGLGGAIDMDRGLTGERYFHVKTLEAYDFSGADIYRLYVSGAGYEVDDYGSVLSGTGHTLFQLKATDRLGAAQVDLTLDWWLEDWTLQYWTGSAWATATGTPTSGADLCAGPKCWMMADNEFPPRQFQAPNVLLNVPATTGASISSATVDDAQFKVLHAAANLTAVTTLTDFRLWGGIYDVNQLIYDYSTETATFYLYDNDLAASGTHPLDGDITIKASANNAIVLAERMWKLDLLLGQGEGISEHHPAGLIYSEFEQLDVFSPSRRIRLPDRRGGKGMGLATSFGSLIVFKQTTHYRLQVLTNEPDALTYDLKESPIERGLISRRGLVQDGDIIYFASEDGIYRTSANLEAGSSTTPLIEDMVSIDIKDIYDAISDKTEIHGALDRNNQRVLWKFSSTAYWAFYLVDQYWAEIEPDDEIDFFFIDNNGWLAGYSSDDDKLHATNEAEETQAVVRTQEIHTNDKRKNVVRHARATYKTQAAIAAQIYADGNYTTAVPNTSHGYAVKSVKDSDLAVFRARANRFQVEITETQASSVDIEIYQLDIEYESNEE